VVAPDYSRGMRISIVVPAFNEERLLAVSLATIRTAASVFAESGWTHELSACVWHGHPSVKVIHGHGSGGGSSRIKPQVLAALRKHA